MLINVILEYNICLEQLQLTYFKAKKEFGQKEEILKLWKETFLTLFSPIIGPGRLFNYRGFYVNQTWESVKEIRKSFAYIQKKGSFLGEEMIFYKEENNLRGVSCIKINSQSYIQSYFYHISIFWCKTYYCCYFSHKRRLKVELFIKVKAKLKRTRYL